MTERPTFDALEDFAGPGGWDEGAKMLGLRFYGVDYDGPACETARAAGHEREQADVTEHASPEWARGKGHVSSPSCTLFSMAGSGIGRLVLDVLAKATKSILAGEDPATVREIARGAIYPVALAEAEAKNAKRKPEKKWSTEKVQDKARLDAKVAALVLEPARRIVELDPEWVALEQVPEVMPIWHAYQTVLSNQGWSVWTGVLNAADYGVPQTRRRAILIASRVRSVQPPAPTHTEHPQDVDLFGESLSKWVCMADALGWQDDIILLSNYNTGGQNGVRGERAGDQPAATVTTEIDRAKLVVDRRQNSKGPGGKMVPTATVSVERPAPTVTGKSGEQWVIRPDEKAPVYVNGNQANAGRRSADEPAPTVLFGHRSNDVRWVFDRPATSVQGDPRIGRPGHKDREGGESQFEQGSVSVSVSEAGVLQSFRPDYPWQGSKSKQYEQVGNAIPPLLAAHVLAAVTGRPLAINGANPIGTTASKDIA